MLGCHAAGSRRCTQPQLCPMPIKGSVIEDWKWLMSCMISCAPSNEPVMLVAYLALIQLIGLAMVDDVGGPDRVDRGCKRVCEEVGEEGLIAFFD
ncbi:hypothetical protein I7I48_12223 [Histoplasma ohiense]|nr:hypothetical protein I7I48_12223 [Histoplasma ohiense (nom. inval.)]